MNSNNGTYQAHRRQTLPAHFLHNEVIYTFSVSDLMFWCLVSQLLNRGCAPAVHYNQHMADIDKEQQINL